MNQNIKRDHRLLFTDLQRNQPLDAARELQKSSYASVWLTFMFVVLIMAAFLYASHTDNEARAADEQASREAAVISARVAQAIASEQRQQQAQITACAAQQH